MSDYIIRGIPSKLWNAVKLRAKSEGRSLRWILLKLLARFVERGVE